MYTIGGSGTVAPSGAGASHKSGIAGIGGKGTIGGKSGTGGGRMHKIGIGAAGTGSCDNHLPTGGTSKQTPFILLKTLIDDLRMGALAYQAHANNEWQHQAFFQKANNTDRA